MTICCVQCAAINLNEVNRRSITAKSLSFKDANGPKIPYKICKDDFLKLIMTNLKAYTDPTILWLSKCTKRNAFQR